MHANTKSNNVNIQETRNEEIVPIEYIAMKNKNNPMLVIDILLNDIFIPVHHLLLIAVIPQNWISQGKLCQVLY